MARKNFIFANSGTGYVNGVKAIKTISRKLNLSNFTVGRYRKRVATDNAFNQNPVEKNMYVQNIVK